MVRLKEGHGVSVFTFLDRVIKLFYYFGQGKGSTQKVLLGVILDRMCERMGFRILF